MPAFTLALPVFEWQTSHRISEAWLLHELAPDASMATELVVITGANVVAAVTRFMLLRYWIFRRVRRARAL